ncbi:MAG: ABC transporter permease [Atribacterota bacterium]|nr:ABC transporter permease [Atribacterota bacterium]
MNRILKKLFSNATSLIGIILLFFFIMIAIFAPAITPALSDNPYQIPRMSWDINPQPPGSPMSDDMKEIYGFLEKEVKWEKAICGTAEGGYDIFYGLIWGTRTAFKIGIITVLISMLIGLILGSISAYFGGWIDEILMRITDIFLSFPFLVAAMVLTTVLGRGLDKVMIALISFGWMGYARLIRGSILSAKEETYVMAAKALGVNDAKIIWKHLLPNTIFPVMVQGSMNIGSMVITAAALSFLGVGAPVGYADWGQMVSFARNWIIGSPGHAGQYWYAVFYPGIFIVLFVLSWNLIGDTLRDILDPRLRGEL